MAPPQAPPTTTRATARRAQVAAAAVAVLAVAGVSWAVQRDGSAPTTPVAPADLASVSGQGSTAPPPWPAPADVPERVRAAGLTLGAMGMAEHVHLDVFVDGERVPLPANLGVDPASGSMAYVHTHTPDGLVHIEAGKVGRAFSLGQLFTEWDVKLTQSQVGALEAKDGKTLTLYVDGKAVPGDPAALLLAPRQQITLVFGSAEVDVPGSYDFAPGD